MKLILKALFFFNILFFVFPSQGQIAIIHGYVLSQNSGIGIPNHQVIIQSNIDTATSTGLNYYSSNYTLQNGFFIDSVSIPSGQNIKFVIKTKDCQNNWKIDSVYSMNSKSTTFLICDSGFTICQTHYMTYPDTANFLKIHFLNASYVNNAKYHWDFGDGDSSTLMNPSHEFPSTGKYLVTLTAIDSVSGCYSVKSDSIKVNPVFNCHNSFKYTTNYLTALFFGKINNNLPTYYQWFFGDNTSANGPNPIHYYQYPGIYNVTLTTISINPQSLDTCISHSTQQITIQPPPLGNIYGQIFTDSTYVSDAEVVLYRYQNSTDDYIAMDTVDVIINNTLGISYYYFHNIQLGKYLTQAKLKTSSAFYNDYGPAYFGNTFDWSISKPFEPAQTGSNRPIHLTRVFHPNGTITVKGQVFEGSQKNLGDPVKGALIYIYNVQNDVVGYMLTDNFGGYSFNNLNPEKYFLHVDVINKTMMPTWVWPDQSATLLDHVDIYIGNDFIAGLQNKANISALIFPNPTEDKLNILVPETIISKGQIQVYDLTGRLQLLENISFNGDNNKLELDLLSLKQGIYTVRIALNGYAPLVKKITIL
ncbi:MAG: PKD domain-containing protein [Bacteroidales bacterium]|nr:PKD domain-containing protein [Bacteroidales bacterium]